jgi:phosphate transport system ATP-binding protein
MMSQQFEVKHLDFYYGQQQVLFDIQAVFRERDVTALIGPSGSGKSTLLRALNRIYELYPQQRAQGEILLNGTNILDASLDVNMLRKRIGMVFQKPTPFPMSIFDNVAFALRLHYKISKADLHERVEKALQQAALWDEVKDKLHDAGTHLSGGQQQRLCIARTIAIQPQVILLDEPTSALDPISTGKIEELIHKLKQKFTIVMVTHNLKQAERIATDTIFMREGHIVESGPTRQLFKAPKDERTKHYIEVH